jgi:hypothetical protein
MHPETFAIFQSIIFLKSRNLHPASMARISPLSEIKAYEFPELLEPKTLSFNLLSPRFLHISNSRSSHLLRRNFAYTIH